MKRILLLFCVASLSQFANAQSSLELGIAGGVSLYSGDLSEDEFGLYFQNLKPAFGFFGRYNINRTLAMRLGFMHGQVQEQEDTPIEGGLFLRSFRSNISEFSFVAELNILRLGPPGGTNLVSYIFGGGALFNFRPETLFDGSWVDLQPLGTEGQGLPGYAAPYKLTQLAVPVGAGLKIDMGSWALSFELGGRKLFTDYLDDISDVKLRYRDILEGHGELAATLSNPTIDVNDPVDDDVSYVRGGPFKDWYYFGTVGVSFDMGGGYGRNSGRNIGCPTF
ncbi:MAG: DUF6089 family protein [Saprospiraceae bacterium]|nr:outer membrane beta-barrel protein [Lewinella sp.]